MPNTINNLEAIAEFDPFSSGSVDAPEEAPRRTPGQVVRAARPSAGQRAQRGPNLSPELYGPRQTCLLPPLAALMLRKLRELPDRTADGHPLWTVQSVVAYGLALLDAGQVPTPTEAPFDVKTTPPQSLTRWIGVRFTTVQTDRILRLVDRLVESKRIPVTGAVLAIIRLAVVATWYDVVRGSK